MFNQISGQPRGPLKLTHKLTITEGTVKDGLSEEVTFKQKPEY